MSACELMEFQTTALILCIHFFFLRQQRFKFAQAWLDFARLYAMSFLAGHNVCERDIDENLCAKNSTLARIGDQFLITRQPAAKSALDRLEGFLPFRQFGF